VDKVSMSGEGNRDVEELKGLEKVTRDWRR
jgi:hypothetical protein